jgi:hypothetical protein
MMDMLHFTTLVIATMFAVAAAVALHWLLLRTVFHLMRPATARKTVMHTELVRGTMQLARAFAPHR